MSLVEVPVTVLDAGGKPVRGLRASDFRVLDEGRDVPIEAVDVLEFATGSREIPAPSAPSVAAAGARRFMLLFDLSFITPAEFGRARQAAGRFVSDSLGPADLAAVATVSTRGPKIVAGFTTDRAPLRKAIAGLRPLAIFSKTITIGDDDDASSRGQYTEEEIDRLQQPGRSHDAGRMETLVRSLAAIGGALHPIPGRKQIVYFSEGFDTMTDGTRLLAPFERILEQLRRDDCVVHTVDVAGVKTASALAAEGGMANNGALAEMAAGTGGEFLSRSNDFGAQIGRVLDATSVVYVLTFHAGASGRPGRYHRLEVKTARTGVRVSARPGYYEPAPL